MLDQIKLALRITTNSFNGEIQTLIDAAITEMTALGIEGVTSTTTDGQIVTAIIAYCKWQFGAAPDADKWEKIYHTKLAQLQTMTGYGLEED